MIKKIILLWLLCSLCNNYAQSDTLQIISEKYSDMIEDFSENEDSEIHFELIEYLINNPVDLNNAGRTELQRIPFLSPGDVNIIINERSKRKGFKSIHELNSVKTLHPDLILIIKPFLILEDPAITMISEKKKFGFQFRSRVISDLQERKGFANGKYEGNELKTYNRLKVNTGDFRFGIITEKDAGEESYIDHYAGFAEYKPDDFIEKVVLGDFNFEFGQGLVLWSPYSFSKGSDAVNTSIKRERQISPHLSSEENKFLRGGAFSLKLNSLKAAGFYSKKNVDANIGDNNEIISLTPTGYHRTIYEISNKENLTETSFGGSLQYTSKNLLIGLLHLREVFSFPFFYKDENNYYGDKFSFTSLALNYSYNKFQFAGELAYNGKGFALLNTVYLGLSERIGISASFRNYSPKYFNFYSNGFGEYNNTQNELGFYLGVKIKFKFGIINSYYDIFKSPSKSYYSYFPIKGNDMMVNYVSNIFTNAKLTLKFKKEEKEVLIENGHKEIIDKELKTNYRITLKYDLTTNWSGKNRIEFVQYSINNKLEEGYLAFQELKYKFGKNYSFLARVIFFQTESYNSRIYEFENDLKGVMTNLPMFGEGVRWYILCNISLIENLNLSLKYSETYKPNSYSLGSGNSEILGDLDNRISLQIYFGI